MFKLVSPFEPAGDQPRAIEQLAAGLRDGAKHQTLLGVTQMQQLMTLTAQMFTLRGWIHIILLLILR